MQLWLCLARALSVLPRLAAGVGMTLAHSARTHSRHIWPRCTQQLAGWPATNTHRRTPYSVLLARGQLVISGARRRPTPTPTPTRPAPSGKPDPWRRLVGVLRVVCVPVLRPECGRLAWPCSWVGQLQLACAPLPRPTTRRMSASPDGGEAGTPGATKASKRLPGQARSGRPGGGVPAGLVAADLSLAATGDGPNGDDVRRDVPDKGVGHSAPTLPRGWQFDGACSGLISRWWLPSFDGWPFWPGPAPGLTALRTRADDTGTGELRAPPPPPFLAACHRSSRPIAAQLRVARALAGRRPAAAREAGRMQKVAGRAGPPYAKL